MKIKNQRTHTVTKRTSSLLSDLQKLIRQTRKRVFVAVNSELVLLYWQIGKRIRKEVLQNKRAGYGKEIIGHISKRLTLEFGSGYSEQSLWHSLRTAESFSKEQIVSAVRRQLSWTHIKIISYLKENLQREFYMELCIHERWSTRLLQNRIDSMLFERTSISKKPKLLIRKELENFRKEGNLSENLVFRDPYFLDFLGLKDTYSEKDLESAMLADLQRFITEIGSDFAFLARQKRIVVDGEDYYLDLLFYHRGMRRLVCIDLKLGNFKASDKSQMELYLRWLEKYEYRDGEEKPIGLILCAGKSEEHVELLIMDEKQIRVAQYLTELPSKKVWKEKLHVAAINAQKKEQTKRLGQKKSAEIIIKIHNSLRTAERIET